MKCPECQFENESVKKFCTECGAALSLKCPNCGSIVKSDEKFCGECSYNLRKIKKPSTESSSKSQSYTPKHLLEKIITTHSSIEGERKILTVLFADIANYTTLSEKLDPEEIHQIMDGCFKILSNEIHKYDGTINQFTGDGVMALFGAPTAYEDHALRACYAALCIQKAIKDYGEIIKKKTGLSFTMRIGLNSGPVIVGSIGDDLRMDYTAVGDTTNLASRMESHAEPGTILVSDNTRKMVNQFFVFNRIGNIAVKGKARLQKAFMLLKASDVATRMDASVANGLTRFVGRHGSMATLLEVYEKVASGIGQVVGIVGEAGVGKSRLLLEFRNNLPKEDFTFLEGQCREYGKSILYLPILDILRSKFCITDSDREYIINKKIRETLLDCNENLESYLPAFQDVLSVSVDEDKLLMLEPRAKQERIFEAIRNLLIGVSQTKPLILIVEDLQWIDKTSQAFLDYLIEWIANSAIMLILLYRTEFHHAWSSKSYYHKIGLDQLGIQSSMEMVKALLEQGDVASELMDLALNRAAGNPLFMEEFIHNLVENGSIQKENNQYVLMQNIEHIEMPDMVQGIIAARIDRLDENLKFTMQLASVIGREFTYRVLQSISGMGEELKSHLLYLQRLELIYEKNLFPELEYIFKHALTREVTYNSILQNRRKKIHENIGKAIEEIYKDRLEETYEVLVYHFSMSQNHLKAYNYLKCASKKAISAYAASDAAEMIKRAIEIHENLFPTNNIEYCDLLIDYGNALILKGEAKHVLETDAPMALSVAEKVSDGNLICRVCLMGLQAVFSYQAGGGLTSPEAIYWADKAEKYCKYDTIDRSKACRAIGGINVAIGRIEKGVYLLNHSVELAKRFGSKNYYWETVTLKMGWADAPQHASEHLQLSESLLKAWRNNEISLTPEILYTPSLIFLAWGQRELCEKLWQEMISWSDTIRLPIISHSILEFDILMSTMNGNLELAVDKCKKMRLLGSEAGFPERSNTYYSILYPRPRFWLRKARNIEPAVNFLPPYMKVFYLAYQGKIDEVKSILDVHVIKRPNIGSNEDETPVWHDILFLESAILTKHRKSVEYLFKRLDGCEYCNTSRFFITSIPRHLGAAASMLGETKKAKYHYLKSISICENMRFRPELALSRFQLAELLFEYYPDEKENAVEHLDCAIDEFKEMNMQPSLEKAQTLKGNL